MPIRVHRVKQFGDGSLELLIRGEFADAAYVASLLRTEKGVSTNEPVAKTNDMAGFFQIRARGTRSNPLSRERALEILRNDQQIAVEVEGDEQGS